MKSNNTITLNTRGLKRGIKRINVEWHRAPILFSPTGIQLFMYLPITIYDLNGIMVTFLFAVLWTDFIHCSAVSTVME